MFYRGVVQTVLLFGAESWVVSKCILSPLEGFHWQNDRRLTGGAPVYLPQEGQWSYPPIENSLEEAGMLTIGEYCHSVAIKIITIHVIEKVVTITTIITYLHNYI
jgi:hypothetical protein